jgi:transposase
MWTAQNRRRYDRSQLRYPSDLTDDEWAHVAPLIPPAKIIVLPKRWIVERTIAWLNRCRRLAKDWENLNRKALAFLRLASIRLMLRKLCNPA